MNHNNHELGDKPVTRLLWQYSLPAIIGTVAFGSTNIINTIFVGNGVGPLALSAIGLTIPIFYIFMAIGMMIGVGGGAVVSLNLGEGKKDQAEHTLGNVFFLLVFFGIVTSFIFYLNLKKILVLFGATDVTLSMSMEYMKIILCGIVFSNLSMGMNHLIRAEGSPKIAMSTLLISSILNVILNTIFIFHYKLGVKGAAYATLISSSISACWVLLHFISKKSSIRLKVRYFFPKLEIVKPIIMIGMSPFSMQILGSLVGMFLNQSLIRYGGEMAIATSSIINSIAMFFFIPIIGINQGAQPIFGFNYGAKKFTRVLQALKLSLLYATLFSTIGFLCVELFPHIIIDLFSKKDQTLQNMAVPALRIFMAMSFIIGAQIIAANFFQSIGRAKISLVLTILRQGIFFLPILFILPQFLGLNGVWLAGPLSDILAALTSFYFLYRENKKIQRKQMVLNQVTV